jgi:phosphoribosylformylglycinamidine synthase
MRACVVVFPGSNADREMVHTLRTVSGIPTTTVWHTDTELPAGVDLVALPGGFSYGDYLRSGAIARVSPIVPAIRRHAERGGYVLGVCNGFQILTEVGLLPGALTRNVNLRFESFDAFVRVEAEGPFTPRKGQVLRLPVAHGDGRYQASPAVLAQLEAEGRVAFRYCDADGEVRPTANFNGSVSSVAGIYGGPRRNVLGLMPHPERMAEAILGCADGRVLFDAVRTARAAAPAAPGASPTASA